MCRPPGAMVSLLGSFSQKTFIACLKQPNQLYVKMLKVSRGDGQSKIKRRPVITGYRERAQGILSIEGLEGDDRRCVTREEIPRVSSGFVESREEDKVP